MNSYNDFFNQQSQAFDLGDGSNNFLPFTNKALQQPSLSHLDKEIFDFVPTSFKDLFKDQKTVREKIPTLQKLFANKNEERIFLESSQNFLFSKFSKQNLETTKTKVDTQENQTQIQDSQNIVKNLFKQESHNLFSRNSFFGLESQQSLQKPQFKKTTKKNNKIKKETKKKNKGKKLVECKCKKSKCLKLYCECFAKGLICGVDCTCKDCHNSEQMKEFRDLVIKETLEKNPFAFKSKYKKMDKENETLHSRGCNCSKTGCIKKYCECYNAGTGCSRLCRCMNCKNEKIEIKDEDVKKYYDRVLRKRRKKSILKDYFEKKIDVKQIVKNHKNN